MRRLRLAVVATHPIQYQVPIFRVVAGDPDIELTAFFGSRIGLDGSRDDEFGTEVSWDVPLLAGYQHRFLRNRRRTATTRFAGLDCPDLAGELRRGHFDGVLVPAYHCYLYLQAFAAALRAGIPILYRPTITDLDIGDAPWRQHARKGMLRTLYRCVSFALAIGKNARRHFEEHGVPAERIVSAPHCVDNTLYRGQADRWRVRREETRRELGMGPEKFVVLFAGKLSPRKDPALLVRAVGASRHSSRLGLVFVGDGVMRAELESLASEVVPGGAVFTGFQNQSMIGKYYAAADCLVLPSRSGETWGLVANDAMNFGLPVIVSDRVGCAGDLVRDGETGYTFPAGDAAALSARLDALAGRPERAARMGARGRSILREYSPEAAARGIKEALVRARQEKKGSSARC